MLEDFSLPEMIYLPAHVGELYVVPLIAGHVGFYLGYPVVTVAVDLLASLAPVTAVPEVTVHEDGHLPFGYGNVGRAGKPAEIETVAYAGMPEGFCKEPFGLASSGMDLLHALGYLFRSLEFRSFHVPYSTKYERNGVNMFHS